VCPLFFPGVRGIERNRTEACGKRPRRKALFVRSGATSKAEQLVKQPLDVAVVPMLLMVKACSRDLQESSNPQD
jgi:hypothetical protein